MSEDSDSDSGEWVVSDPAPSAQPMVILSQTDFATKWVTATSWKRGRGTPPTDHAHAPGPQ